MKRAIVDVATGRYLPYQARLFKRLAELGTDATPCFYSLMPHGCPPHHEKPYAFKAYALMAAVSLCNPDLILWVDSVIYPVKELDLLWEKIEHEGYWIALNGWTNYQWTCDAAYADLFKGWKIEEAREVNRKIPHVVATAFGLNLRTHVGKEFLSEYFRLAQTNAFCGPWKNENGSCGPEDVLGHRHDQTAASLIAWRLGMKLTECPNFFSYPPAAPNTILVADGGNVYGRSD